MEGKCAICEREEKLTRHHLIPRTRHHNKRNKREFDRATVKKVAGICRPCHSQIHALLTEKELERDYRTVERLRDHPEIRKFAAWIATKPRGFRCGTRPAE
ncbi:MAG: hypothetical protein P4L99_29405 [Chthoniobacter sp.]|nr:hypothetical protein [Chthoniobacter sp.]